MIRIPLGNERSKRVEVRSIAPDANPYLAIYAIFRTGLEGPLAEGEAAGAGAQPRYLSDNIYDAIRLYQGSRFYRQMLGEEVHGKFADLKAAQADRCPRALGTVVKAAEVQFHHEVSNQHLWSQF
jgi:glutamine synthetase